MKNILLFFVFVLSGIIAFTGAVPAVFAAPAEKSTRAKDAESSDELESKIEDLPGDNFSMAWPKVTRLADMLPAKIIQEEPGKNIYETEHFVFTATAPIMLSAVREIARVFEGTREANLALPINSPCNYYQVAEKGKLKAYLFETREQYLEAIGSKSFESSLGVCLTTDKLETTSILVPFASLGLEKGGKRYKKSARKIENSTLSHELTHFMTLPGNKYPSWFSEGVAEYVGNTPYVNGRFLFSNNRRALVAYASDFGKDGKGGRAIGKDVKMPLSLENFFNQNYKQFLEKDRVQLNYGFSTLLVYYFFHIDGKRNAARIKAFLGALQSGAGEAVAYEKLLDGRSWEKLEKDVARGMKSLGVKVEFPK